MKNQPFYSEYMEKSRPKPPYCICKNKIKRLLGVISPSLCWYVAAGGKGKEAEKELEEYNKKEARYLCYKRQLSKERWKVLYGEYRRTKSAFNGGRR